MSQFSSSRPVPEVDPDRSTAPGSFFVPVGEVASGIVSGLSESVRRNRLPIETAWVDFLSKYEWQWFATFTFKEAIHPEAADKRFRYWTRVLDESNGVNPRKPATSKRRCFWVRGLEWQRRDVLHFHALMGNLPYEICSTPQMKLWQEAWLTLGERTGFAKILPVGLIGGACGYVSKYCAKGGEIDVSTNLPHWRPDLAGSVTAA
jgi:hypothetical protein